MNSASDRKEQKEKLKSISDKEFNIPLESSKPNESKEQKGLMFQKEAKDLKELLEQKGPKEPKEPKEPNEPREPKEPKEPKDPKDLKDLKEFTRKIIKIPKAIKSTDSENGCSYFKAVYEIIVLLQYQLVSYLKEDSNNLKTIQENNFLSLLYNLYKKLKHYESETIHNPLFSFALNNISEYLHFENFDSILEIIDSQNNHSSDHRRHSEQSETFLLNSKTKKERTRINKSLNNNYSLISDNTNIDQNTDHCILPSDKINKIVIVNENENKNEKEIEIEIGKKMGMEVKMERDREMGANEVNNKKNISGNTGKINCGNTTSKEENAHNSTQTNRIGYDNNFKICKNFTNFTNCKNCQEMKKKSKHNSSNRIVMSENINLDSFKNKSNMKNTSTCKSKHANGNGNGNENGNCNNNSNLNNNRNNENSSNSYKNKNKNKNKNEDEYKNEDGYINMNVNQGRNANFNYNFNLDQNKNKNHNLIPKILKSQNISMLFENAREKNYKLIENHNNQNQTCESQEIQLNKNLQRERALNIQVNNEFENLNLNRNRNLNKKRKDKDKDKDKDKNKDPLYPHAEDHSKMHIHTRNQLDSIHSELGQDTDFINNNINMRDALNFPSINIKMKPKKLSNFQKASKDHYDQFELNNLYYSQALSESNRKLYNMNSINSINNINNINNINSVQNQIDHQMQDQNKAKNHFDRNCELKFKLNNYKYLENSNLKNPGNISESNFTNQVFSIFKKNGIRETGHLIKENLPFLEDRTKFVKFPQGNLKLHEGNSTNNNLNVLNTPVLFRKFYQPIKSLNSLNRNQNCYQSKFPPNIRMQLENEIEIGKEKEKEKK